MSYNQQILMNLTGGRYGKKTYLKPRNRVCAEPVASTMEPKVLPVAVVPAKPVASVASAFPPSNLLDEKILELEEYVVDIGVQIESLKINQQNIIGVINKLSTELNAMKSRIVR